MRELPDGRLQWRDGHWIAHTEGDFSCEFWEA